MSTERYTLDDLDADELSAVMAHRARKSAPPAPKPNAAPKRRLDRVTLLASLALVCVMLVLAGFKVAEYVAAYAAAFSGAQPTAEPLPTAPAYVRSAPVSAPQPRSAPVAAPSDPYTLTVPPYQAGAWTPGGPFELDVAGRRYRALGQQGGATYAELDDGTTLWLGTAAVAGPGSVSGGRWDAAPVTVPDEVAANAGQAAGENAGAVDANGHVLPYDPSNPTAVATWNQALRNSGVDVDATQVACNADLAAGGLGCQP